MKSLDTGKLYIKDLFGKARFYQIPEYQRSYVWETQQIGDLLNDISTAMDADAEKEYFLGCMIWNVVGQRSNGYNFDCRDILDGQQRLITLLLLHAVLRDISDDPKLKKKVQQRLKQEEDKYDNVPSRNRILFAVRTDRTFLNKFIMDRDGTRDTETLRHVAQDSDEPNSIRTMAQAVLDIQTWWEQRIAEVPDAAKYLRDFFGYLSNKVLVLYLATPDNLDDAYNLFTVLNSRGLQLSSGDILRAQNLRKVDDESRRRELAKGWDECIDAIREPLTSFDELLKYTALAKIRFTSDKTRSIKAAFEYLFKKEDLAPGEEFFTLISAYSAHFRAISGSQGLKLKVSERTDFENIFFILSQTFGGRFLMPLMHYRERFSDYRILDFLIRLDNLVSMAWLLGRRTLQQRMFLLVRAMDDAATGPGRTTERADRFLDDKRLDYGFKYQNSRTDMLLAEFEDLLNKEPWGAYGGTRLNKPRYILLKLDLLHGSQQTRLSFNRAASTVEHLLPRTPQAGTTVAKSAPEWVHRLGNLALLDRKKNSALSNAEFSVKRKRYQGSFETRPYTNSIFLKHEKYGVREIQAQHKYALSVLIDYYRMNSVEGLRVIRSRRDSRTE